MLRRITLENFMSHKHTVIDLAAGLTVLTGPNNCGKSAVVSALQILASNGKTTHVMRHGEKLCRITAETDDGHLICWQRKGSSVSYTLDGEEIHRIGQGIPDGLHELLRLPAVEAETGKSSFSYDIHFGEQKSPVFLLGDPGSRAASFFASSSDASRLVEMQHLHRTRVADHRKDARRLTAESENAAGELQRFATLDAADQRLTEVEQQFDLLRRSQGTIAELSGHIDVLESSATQIGRLETEAAALSRLHAPPNLHDTPQLQQLINDLNDTATLLDTSARLKQACAPLQPPPVMNPTAACRRLIDDLKHTIHAAAAANTCLAPLKSLIPPPALQDTRDLRRMIDHLSDSAAAHLRLISLVAALRPLEAPASRTDIGPLRELIDKLREAMTDVEQYASLAGSLKSLPPPKDPRDGGTLAATITGLAAAESALRDTRRRDAENAKALEEFEELVKRFVSEYPECPTCGAEVDPAQLLSSLPGAGGHAHG